MPHFSNCGNHDFPADEYICQKCGRVKCSECHKPQWRTDITGNKSAGNVCPSCVKEWEKSHGKG